MTEQIIKNGVVTVVIVGIVIVIIPSKIRNSTHNDLMVIVITIMIGIVALHVLVVTELPPPVRRLIFGCTVRLFHVLIRLPCRTQAQGKQGLFQWWCAVLGFFLR